MAVNITETQAKILKVENARGRITIEADIPVLGKFPTRFIRWAGSGLAPASGDEVMATMQPTARQKRFITDGTFNNDLIDGEEMPWQVNWQMTASHPLEGGNGGGVGNTDGEAQASRSAVNPSNGKGGVQRGVAVNTVATVAAAGIWFENLDDLIKQADKFNQAVDIIEQIGRGTYVAGLAASDPKINSPLVEKADSLGAVVTDVKPRVVVPDLESEADVKTWVKEQGWTREQVTGVLKQAGFDSASEYLAHDGHTPAGLASMIREVLG